jgi:CRISPR-associated protein Cmr1
MESITFDCEVITPMFLAGADGTTPELRPASIKGALRFWWRAMNGHLELEGLRKKEGEIFGGTEEGMGRSKLIIRILDDSKIKIRKYEEMAKTNVVVGKFNLNIFKYMTYGVWGGGKSRDFIEEGSRFTLLLSFPETLKNDILSAFYCLVNYGAIGAKARNGFGCIGVVSTNSENARIKEAWEKIKTLPSFTNELAPYTAFSKESSFTKTEEVGSWKDSLSQIQTKYVLTKQTFGTVEKNYIASHAPKSLGLERKAKFCFLNVQKIKDKYIGRITCIPYLLDSKEPKHNTTLISFSKKIKTN